MDMEYRFELVVNGVNEEQADGLLSSFIAVVQALGGKVGGGFSQVEEKKGDATHEQEKSE